MLQTDGANASSNTGQSVCEAFSAERVGLVQRGLDAPQGIGLTVDQLSEQAHIQCALLAVSLHSQIDIQLFDGTQTQQLLG